jgi:hypothetical protein
MVYWDLQKYSANPRRQYCRRGNRVQWIRLVHIAECVMNFTRTRLRDIRAGMRQRLKHSPLLDGITYTRNLEAAYRNVWTKWCG